MHASKIVIFLLAFVVAIASSRPVGPLRRRKTCKAPAVSDVEPSVVPTPTSKPQLNQSAPSKPTPSQAYDDAPPATKATQSADKDDDEPKSTAKTQTADDSKPTKDSSSSSSSSSHTTPNKGGLLAALFPVSDSDKSWSTADNAPASVPLSDATFRPQKMISSLSHEYVDFEGKNAMKAHFPKGSYTFGNDPEGGISFYAPGPSDVDLTDAKEATFGYSVYFPEGFDFNKGGKLPGLYGGDSEGDAVSCSGGRRSTNCHSERLMWRADGAGELYTYLPMTGDWSVNKKQCDVGPQSECNPTYGASVGRGSFKFATGSWTTISERVQLNDVGQNNGEMELFVNGKSVIHVNGLKFRDSSAGRLRGIQMQTFFGGHDSSYASPKSQDIYFADFSVAITQSL